MENSGKGKVLQPSKEDIRQINERANMSKWMQKAFLKADCAELINNYTWLVSTENGEQVLN